MHAKYSVVTLALLFHAAISWADATTSQQTGYQPLAAQYTETRSATDGPVESADWYFTRQQNQVETVRGEYAEVWQRDERGEITLSRIFHHDQKLIHYTPGQLRTEGRQQDWSVLSSVINLQALSTLEQVETVSYLDRPALRYEGKQGRDRIEVIWLVEENLLAKLNRSSRDVTIILELKDLRSSPASGWPQANLSETGTYAALDGADLGDMEYDPFVKRVLAADSAEGQHHH